MGSFDYIEVGDKDGQVKLWDCELVMYRVGDTVPQDGDFSIAMREGGYVNIQDGKLKSWTDAPEFTAILDKWGAEFSPEDVSRGLLGGDYFFEETE